MCPMRSDVSVHNSMSASRSSENEPNSNDGESKEKSDNTPSPDRKTSMGTLITWNVSKALESNPHLDLRSAIRAAQARMEESPDLSSALALHTAAERHLVCAALAWQQLGHSCRDADDLYRFVELRLKEKNDDLQKSVETSENGFSSDIGLVTPSRCRDTRKSLEARRSERASARWPPVPGPVLMLPVDPKIVMHLDTKSGKSVVGRATTRRMPDVNRKIESACCMDSSCTEKLQAVDKETQQLRTRAARLAQREAARVALLERAEAAWRDLEAGYERRLRLAEEKESEIEHQVAKLIHERNNYKRVCSVLAEELSARTSAAEKQRAELSALEKQVCSHACERASVAEQAARGDALLAEQLCLTTQLDRDLLLREEQARRRQMALESEADAAQALTHEAERALQGELCAIKAQMEQVARELQLEEEQATGLKETLADLRQQRDDLTEDLESCTMKCDGRMKSVMDELKAKREELATLRLQEMDCHCKLPVDVAIEVKRTPSLAALCHCSPEEKLAESCSCTSLRTRLLSNLLSDLFSGLQAEMNVQDTQMPCQLLKCLEDKHNWDRSTAVKTRLRDFFSKLLLGELDIAIATAIEKYHVKWVGESCADAVARLKPPPDGLHTQGWQERALEMKAQKMAIRLAEQLFKDKAKELAQQAKNILAETGRPPCECHPETCCPSQSTFPCLVDSPKITVPETDSNRKVVCGTPDDVGKLKMEIEALKRDIIKREDLNMMEVKIAKMVQMASPDSPTISLRHSPNPTDRSIKKDTKNYKPVSNVPLFRNNRSTSKYSNQKKPMDYPTSLNKSNRACPCGVNNRSVTSQRPTQQYAVNLCLLDAKKKSSLQSKVIQQLTIPSKLSYKQSPYKNNMTNIKQPETITSSYQECTVFENHHLTQNCLKNCICFHKKPSNTSIDKLLETLTKWKMDLVASPVKLNVDKSEDTKSLVKTSQKSSSYTQNHCAIGDKKSTENNSTDAREGSKASSKNLNPIIEIKQVSETDVNTGYEMITDSEYMGAINLEKSADNYCQCKDSRKVRNSSDKNITQFPFKCIYSAKCVCKDSTTVPIRHEQGVDAQSFLFKKVISAGNKTLLDQTAEFCTDTVMGDVAKPSYCNIFQSPANPLPRYDNYIKCLGVTLTNISSKKKHRKHKNKNVQNIRNMSSVDSAHKNDIAQIKLESPEKKSYKGCEFNQSHDNSSHDPNLTLKEDQVDANKSGTEKYRAINLPDELKDEPCICCINYDDSNDLEVNTFQLLEEHLKGKLDELKHSLCIPNAEEEKIFNAIIQRIKQLISESTSSVTCKCVGTKHVNGSWNRAYSLLKEYIRTKIKRMKCQCETDKLNNKSDIVLPNILKNISYLIENDFQRLKEICKCKNKNTTQLVYNEKSCGELTSMLLSEAKHKIKEPTDFEHDHVPTSDKQYDAVYLEDLFFRDSKRPDIFTSNMSAQVSLYPPMETRSCEAVLKESRIAEVQTIDDLRRKSSLDGYNSNKNGCDGCVIKSNQKYAKQLPSVSDQNTDKTEADVISCQKTCAILFPIGTNINNDVLDRSAEIGILNTQIIDHRDIKNNSHKSSSPYIGYTLECTCNSDLGCVCAKSTVRGANDRLKIKDIWKKNTNKKVAFPDVSYVLDSAPDKLPTTVNRVGVTGDFVPKSVTEMQTINVDKNGVRDSQVSANKDSGIKLKKSKDKVNSCNETTNTLKHYRSSISDNKVGGSFKPRGVLSSNRRKSEHLSIMKCNEVDNLNTSEYILSGHNSKALSTNSVSCGCKMVPICHVKMLVSSIEDKLANAQCTCDPLSSKVCPVHCKPTSN